MKKTIILCDPKIEVIRKSIELPALAKTKDVYIDLLEVIISQQLSGAIAKIIFNRFLELFENNYPKPEILASIEIETLRNAGLSYAKANYVKNVAGFSITHDISITYIDTLADNEVIELLTKIKGVGKWSVEMILIFSLLRPDVFPYDDLVIKKSMIDVYGIKAKGKTLIKKMESISEKWRPNRALVSRYLWAHWGLKMQQQKKDKK